VAADRGDRDLSQPPGRQSGGTAEGRALEPPRSDQVRFICVGADHVRIGTQVPDGDGHITLCQGSWAYCAAGRPTEAHLWREVTSRPLRAIRHSSLADAGAD
jgi:hypothetical protein